MQSHEQKTNSKQQQRTGQNIQRQKKEKPTGRVEELPKYVTQFIENYLRGRIVTIHPDGHCVRRAIGKI
jgi:hypothetical protein